MICHQTLYHYNFFSAVSIEAKNGIEFCADTSVTEEAGVFHINLILEKARDSKEPGQTKIQSKIITKIKTKTSLGNNAVGAETPKPDFMNQDTISRHSVYPFSNHIIVLHITSLHSQ